MGERRVPDRRRAAACRRRGAGRRPRRADDRPASRGSRSGREPARDLGHGPRVAEAQGGGSRLEEEARRRPGGRGRASGRWYGTRRRGRPRRRAADVPSVSGRQAPAGDRTERTRSRTGDDRRPGQGVAAGDGCASVVARSRPVGPDVELRDTVQGDLDSAVPVGPEDLARRVPRSGPGSPSSDGRTGCRPRPRRSRPAAGRHRGTARSTTSGCRDGRP